MVLLQLKEFFCDCIFCGCNNWHKKLECATLLKFNFFSVVLTNSPWLPNYLKVKCLYLNFRLFFFKVALRFSFFWSTCWCLRRNSCLVRRCQKCCGVFLWLPSHIRFRLKGFSRNIRKKPWAHQTPSWHCLSCLLHLGFSRASCLQTPVVPPPHPPPPPSSSSSASPPSFLPKSPTEQENDP